MDNDGAVNNPQCFADIVIGDQHAQPATRQLADQIANFANRDRVDTGERLIQ